MLIIEGAVISILKHFQASFTCRTTCIIWDRNKSYQLELYFSEQTDITGRTTTLQLGSDAVDMDSGDFQDVTSSDVKDDINLQAYTDELVWHMHICFSLHIDVICNTWWHHNLEIIGVKVCNIRPQLKGGVPPQCWFAPKSVSLVDKIYF